MKLQDFLGKNTRYDIKGISEDDELSRQVQTRLIDLGLLDPPVDGVFGPKSTAGLHQFQKLMECGEAGYLGAVTAKKLIEAKREQIPVATPILKTVKSTVFKVRVFNITRIVFSIVFFHFFNI